ncbi:protein 4 [Halhan virus 2]|uniref:protein 4 n=1 Tax=Halhan virus 2 TaxID=2480177 RepID=UPI000F0D0843|nr:protein 4 [Halhan virus 2]AYN75553.1 protein 4 [Halhan virus 2]
MDSAVPRVESDFISTGGVQDLTTTDNSAQVIVRQQYDFLVMSDSHDAGYVLLNIPLDVSISPSAQKLSEFYELFEIKDLTLESLATSPFGTSSGGYQTCHITDPENAAMFTGTDLDRNIEKVVRQQGSKLVRPRDTVVLKAVTQGTKFTLRAGSPRWYSYGAIVAVVRDVPATGDQIQFALTLTAKVVFHRTTTQNIANSTSAVHVLEAITDDKGGYGFVIDIPSYLHPTIAYIPRKAVIDLLVKNSRGHLLYKSIELPNTITISGSRQDAGRRVFTFSEFDDAPQEVIKALLQVKTLTGVVKCYF